MIDVLLVDDNDQKSAKIIAVIEEIVGQHGVSVQRAHNLHEAASPLRKQEFDLMIVDLNIPRRAGEEPVPNAGVKLIESLSQRVNGFKTPVHIVGLTAFKLLVSEYEKFFDERLWHLVYYDDSVGDWAGQLGQKLVHIAETKIAASPRKQYEYDLAIVTALHHVELESVLALDGDWMQRQLEGDETLYHVGEFKKGEKRLSIVAAAAVEMGMPAITALSMNIISRFQPRYLAMTGIAAGIKGNFGDILIATHSWDYGCGKSRYVEGRSEFLPAPSQIQINPLLKSKLSLFCLNERVFRDIQAGWTGSPAPSMPLSYRMGPIASGAAVVENGPLIEEIKAHNAKVIGVEMETYGVFLAARLCREPRPIAISVKSICDFGDLQKNDEYQRYAGYTSARFLHDFTLAQL